MTSINAMRFNEWSGACVCDEMTSMDDDMSVLVSDKITPCVPEEVTAACGLVAAYGSTGTCSVGDRIKRTIFSRLRARFAAELGAQAGASFLNLHQVGELTYEIILEMKRRRLSEMVEARYGFSLDQFTAGSYNQGCVSIPIKDPETINQVMAMLTWKDKLDEVDFLFLNAGLLAGYDEERGFDIYHFCLREGYWHPVQAAFLAEGSGRDSVNPVLADYMGGRPLELRRRDLDPADALLHLIRAVNYAADRNIGVGGYYNIILIDGKRPRDQRLREINDDRAYLAQQIARAWDRGFLDRKPARSLIEEVLLEGVEQEKVRESFWSQVRRPRQLSRVLRGYRVE